MKKRTGLFLFSVSGAMELIWLYSWATFVTASILHRSFPLMEAIIAFSLATALTLLSKGRGWRIVRILGLQALGFVFTVLRILHAFYSWSSPFFSQAWLMEFFNTPRGPLDWFVLVLLLSWALLFWIGGVRLARRSLVYTTLCTRFDWGLGAFFLLVLTKFLLKTKGGIEIDDRLSQLLLFPYFISSLLAIGLARNQSAGSRDFLPGYQGIGVILSFTFTVLLFGTGLVFFCLPYMTFASKVGYDALKIGAKPLGLLFVAVLRFLFFRNAGRMDAAPPQKEGVIGNSGPPIEGGWWTELIEKVLAWGILGLSGMVLLILSGLAGVYLFRWLFSKTSVSQRRQNPWDLFLSWAAALKFFLFTSWSKIVRKVKGYQRAAQLYHALLYWGRHSGLSHLLSETPAEYCSRLKRTFPVLKREIELIMEAFHQEVYGERDLDEQQLAAIRSAWRRLCSPLHWPSRLKTRVFQSSQTNGFISNPQ